MTKTLRWPLVKKLFFHACCLTPPNVTLFWFCFALAVRPPSLWHFASDTPNATSCTKQPGRCFTRPVLASLYEPRCDGKTSAFSQEAFLTLVMKTKNFVECEFFAGSFTLPGNCQGSKAFQLVVTSHSSHDFSSRRWSVGSDKSHWGPAPAWHRRQDPAKNIQKKGRKDDKKNLGLDGHSRHLH